MLNAIQQSQSWLKFQNSLPERSSFEQNGIFCYHLKLSSWLSFIYIPGITEPISQTDWQAIKQQAKQHKAAFIHIEPYSLATNDQNKSKAIKSPFSYIEKFTRILDLNLTEAQLLEQMKSKGRYNIRLSQKKGLEIKQETDVTNFYKLLTETTTRDGFSGHKQNYYQSMVDQLGRQNCKIWTAFYNKIPVASIVCTFHKNTATYYYGASSNQHRNLMAPYLLQWHAITHAKQEGYTQYDLLGIAPPKSKNHKLAGVSAFKAQFGGTIIELAQAVDIPLSWKYWVYWLKKKVNN